MVFVFSIFVLHTYSLKEVICNVCIRSKFLIFNHAG